MKVDRRWIPNDPGTALYIRPFVFATDASLKVHPATTYKYMVILSPVGAYYKEGLNPVKFMSKKSSFEQVSEALDLLKPAVITELDCWRRKKPQAKGALKCFG